jgi:RNA polymerase sigma-70 factor (ECF subfamily)
MDSTSFSLLLRLRQPGDRAAWERFVDLYTPLLFHWAMRLGLQEQDAADLVQDVLLALLHKLPDFQYDPAKSFRAWLRTLAVNKYRDSQRRRAAALHGGQSADLADLAVPDAAEAVWQAEYQRHLLGQAVRLMQSDFQPTTWKVCWALIVEGRPGAEVAAQFGLSLDAVYAARSRVLRRLRQELQGLLD